MGITYRPAEHTSDFRFVVETWLDSYRSSKTAGPIPMEIWHKTMRPVFLHLLQRPGVSVHVASWEGEEHGLADLAGWMASERLFEVSRRVRRFGRWCRRMVVCDEPLVHYCYVKQPYRKQGIARGLFAAQEINPEEPFRYAVKTGVVSALASKVPQATWDPMTVRHPRRPDAPQEEIA